MSAPGDITDEFDDDALRETIERAEAAGEWRDGSTGFVDPKLAAIEKQLAEPELELADYAERRRRELQRRAATPVAGTQEPSQEPWQAGPVNTFAEQWREAEPPAAPAAPARTATVAPPPPGPSYVGSRRSAQPVLTTIRPLLTGFGVFVPVATAQALLAGWHYDVVLRTAVAAIAAGFLWQRFDAERFRAAVIGTAVHLVAFFLTSLQWTVRDTIANCTGLVIALIGALVVGSIEESRRYLADRP